VSSVNEALALPSFSGNVRRLLQYADLDRLSPGKIARLENDEECSVRSARAVFCTAAQIHSTGPQTSADPVTEDTLCASAAVTVRPLWRRFGRIIHFPCQGECSRLDARTIARHRFVASA